MILISSGAVKSFSDENLTWCGGAQQWKLVDGAVNSSPAVSSEPDDGPAAAAAVSSLRMRVARAWSSRDLLDRLATVSVRPSAAASRARRRAHPHKVLSSVEPITEPIVEFEPPNLSAAAPPTPPPPEVSPSTGSDNAAAAAAAGRTVGDVLRQTVDFLVYEVEPVLIAEHLRRARRRSSPGSKAARWDNGSSTSSPLLMSTDQLRRLLTDIVSDTESEEFATFCRLLRKLDTERGGTAEFLEALHLALTAAATGPGRCRCRCCLERRARRIVVDDDDDDGDDVDRLDSSRSSWDVQVQRALFLSRCLSRCLSGGLVTRSSVAEWLACWTQVQKGLGSNRSRDAVRANCSHPSCVKQRNW